MAAGDKASGTLASAVTATATQTAVNIGNGKLNPVANVRIAQVGTATTAAVVDIQTSVDGTNYSTYTTRTAGKAAATYSWSIAIPSGVTHVRTSFTQQSGGTSSTLNAELGWTTSA